MTETRRPAQSPSVAALDAELAAGNNAALDAFWRRITEAGTPLIEPLADGSGRSLVTILYRGQDAPENMLILSLLAEDGQDEMARVPGTDLFYRTYTAQDELRTVYNLLANHRPIDWLRLPLREAEAALGARAVEARHDEHNPRVFDPRLPLPNGGSAPVSSVVELPGAPAQPWLAPREGIGRGRVTSQRLDSAIMGNAHIVWTYAPPGYAEDGEPYDLMIMFDGYAYTHTIDTPMILDNLMSESRIRPLVVAFVQGADRLSELLCNPLYARFIAEELVPWMRQHFNVSPADGNVAAAGMSAGGLAASFMALERPDVFGRVLSQSGSYWWRPEGDREHEWLTRQYVESRAAGPIRFYLDVGSLERGRTFGNGPSQIIANRHMRDVLRARGHDVTYAEFSGGHDYVCWRGTLADGLITLFGV